MRHADLSLQASLVAQIFSAVGQGIPWGPPHLFTDREASMILFRIVFAVTAILLGRDAFAEPGMWIGTAPFCSGSPADCTDLGMTYVKSDSRGDGDKCWTGIKVFCSGYPAPEIGFMGYDDCDGFQCHRTMCGSNPVRVRG